MPKRIEQVFEQPKVREVIEALGDDAPVKAQIEFELIQLAALMSVGGNLNRAQIPFIAEQLIMLYPNESIADFKLCFQRGAIGLYGDIQRLDGVTIGVWMKNYLDEKYLILEDQMMKEKDNIYKPEPDAVDEKLKPLTGEARDAAIKKWAEACLPGNKVPSMSEDEIRKNGKEKVKKKSITSGYTYFNVRGVQIYASTQEHAEELAQIMIKQGLLIE